MSSQVDEYLQFAILIAKQAGALAEKLRATSYIKKQKDEYHNYATNADIEVENLLLDQIKKKYPDHSILTEESTNHETTSPLRWIIDPIDGTWRYKTGQYNYAVLVALEDKFNLQLSVAYFPRTQELFASSLTSGTCLNGQRVKISNTSDLAACFVFINPPSFKTPLETFDWKFNLIKSLTLATYKSFISHSSSIDLFKVALGTCDGLINSQGTGGWWDHAAGICAVLAAGGKVTTFAEKQVTGANFKEGYIASNGIIHKKLLNLVRQTK